jgi:hypothetical protein
MFLSHLSAHSIVQHHFSKQTQKGRNYEKPCESVRSGAVVHEKRPRVIKAFNDFLNAASKDYKMPKRYMQDIGCRLL